MQQKPTGYYACDQLCRSNMIHMKNPREAYFALCKYCYVQPLETTEAMGHDIDGLEVQIKEKDKAKKEEEQEVVEIDINFMAKNKGTLDLFSDILVKVTPREPEKPPEVAKPPV